MPLVTFLKFYLASSGNVLKTTGKFSTTAVSFSPSPLDHNMANKIPRRDGSWVIFASMAQEFFFHMITLRGALRDERVIALQYLNICYSSNHQCMQSCNIPRLICVSTITVRKNLFRLECVFCCNSRLVYTQRWCEGRPVECECP